MYIVVHTVVSTRILFIPPPLATHHSPDRVRKVCEKQKKIFSTEILILYLTLHYLYYPKIIDYVVWVKVIYISELGAGPP